MTRSEMNGYKGIEQKRLTLLTQRAILEEVLGKSHLIKGVHERNGAANNPKERWLDATQAHQVEGSRILVCCQADKWQSQGNLHSTSFPVRAPDRRASAWEASQNKIKPACCWSTTIEKSAVSLSLQQPGKLTRDKPWYRLLIFSIALAQREVKVTQDMGTR